MKTRPVAPATPVTPVWNPAAETPAPLRLHGHDLLEMEPLLAAALRRFLPFHSHSLYFPDAATAPQEPQWLPQERTLLLPLWRREALLGVFTARGADARTVKRLLPHLPALAAMCLDNVELIRQSRHDALTGLAEGRLLLERMAREADTVRGRFARGAASDDEDSRPLHRACMALLVVRCVQWEDLAAEHGYLFADSLTVALAEALGQSLDAMRQTDRTFEALAARMGENEFAVLLPAAAHGACRKLAATLLPALDAVCLTHPLSHRRVRARCVLGHALYPQDMDAALLPLSMDEQARILLHKARLAVQVAQERYLADPQQRHMAYNTLLAEGGLVRASLPLDRVEISLGWHVGAREGQRFTIYGGGHSPAGPVLKGEITLAQVRAQSSVAEVLFLTDPALLPEVGDSVRLLPEGRRASLEQADNRAGSLSAEAVAGNVLRHGEFLRLLPRHCEGRAVFSVSLLRLADGDEEHREAQLSLLEGLCRQWLPEPVLMARYGERSLALLHADPEKNRSRRGRGGEKLSDILSDACKLLCAQAAAQGVELAVGLASWPCLHFTRTDALECARKALDMALLLPAPRVGVFGSLALHVSADKRYSRGDVFGAVEEYQRALLVDKGNGMAWNSLGVCMAALSRYQEARGHFTKALQGWKKFLRLQQQGGEVALPLWLPAGTTLAAEYTATLYNLGTVCQSLGERRAAAHYFRLCAAADPGHYFARIRLGQGAEESGRSRLARRYYEEAAHLEEQGATPHLARRHLARLAAKGRRWREARELLHEALVLHPQDTAAMILLGELCLDGGEDPSMAEMLARRSLAVRESMNGWKLLTLALRAQDRHGEADEAEARALARGPSRA